MMTMMTMMMMMMMMMMMSHKSLLTFVILLSCANLGETNK